MVSHLRCFTVVLGLGLFSCGSSSSDPGADGGSTTGAGTTTGTGGGPPKCTGALTETNLGIVGGVAAIVPNGTDLFYSAIPDVRNGDITGKPSYVARLPIAGGTPSILVTTTKGGLALSSLGVDTENVYFHTHDSELAKIPKAGGTPTTVATLSALITLNLEFALDPTSIFYFDSRTLRMVSKDGGSPTKVWEDEKISPTSPVIDGEDFYFAGRPPTMFFSDAGPSELDSVYRLAKTGGTPTKVTQLTSDLKLGESIWHLAVDGPSLVFSTITDPFGPSVDVTIYSVPKSGGTSTKLATGGPPFAAQGGTVYFADRATIKKVPVGGGTPVEVVAVPDGAAAISLDATNVYWESLGCIYKTAR
jgi:hypothetical protein